MWRLECLNSIFPACLEPKSRGAKANLDLLHEGHVSLVYVYSLIFIAIDVGITVGGKGGPRDLTWILGIECLV